MSPKERATPPWRRESAGTYRSSDDRFTIRGEGSGRWFLLDDEERDELGLPRTIGPVATLDAAKAGAEQNRGRAPAKSPLAGRIKASDRRPRGSSPGRSSPRSRGAKAQTSSTPKGSDGPRKAPETWLDRLQKSDPGAANRARGMIEAVLDVISMGERLERADDRLPGWRLVERRGPGERRVRTTSDDVQRVGIPASR